MGPPSWIIDFKHFRNRLVSMKIKFETKDFKTETWAVYTEKYLGNDSLN